MKADDGRNNVLVGTFSDELRPFPHRPVAGIFQHLRPKHQNNNIQVGAISHQHSGMETTSVPRYRDEQITKIKSNSSRARQVGILVEFSLGQISIALLTSCFFHFWQGLQKWNFGHLRVTNILPKWRSPSLYDCLGAMAIIYNINTL